MWFCFSLIYKVKKKFFFGEVGSTSNMGLEPQIKSSVLCELSQPGVPWVWLISIMDVNLLYTDLII